jgi:hypothetical protein
MSEKVQRLPPDPRSPSRNLRIAEAPDGFTLTIVVMELGSELSFWWGRVRWLLKSAAQARIIAMIMQYSRLRMYSC